VRRNATLLAPRLSNVRGVGAAQRTMLYLMSDTRVPAIKVVMHPKDTNAYGTIFGGVILAHIDTASAVEAQRHGPHKFVTKAMREVVFVEPVFVGDLVNFFTETVRVGRTSVTVKVTVESERLERGFGERVKVTEAEVILVAIDAHGRPRPIRPEPVQA